ncbi:mechanosensitive ion channel family protein [Kitasatospora cheerisanensis]|uniref:Mechanosensitive ion channel protein n=1 Tax=Kitasatospora cheerisanensis KCTC 2395 TaxID=1348663 RepID=A0A066Z261_9ACTN|nr:mechanosensitive ion channel family protein [Kitasatospora cheerisanensis]KDN86324.1 mechanosensitive ion channel protein [Kitasatospora cheerisanensis KCTC 2395]
MLWPLASLLSAIFATFLAGWLVDQILQRLAARHPDSPVWESLRRCRIPFQLALLTALLLLFHPTRRLFPHHDDAAVRHTVLLALIASLGWLTVRVLAATLEAVLARYETVTEDASRIGRVRTQLGLVRRVGSALVWVVTVGAMLLTFGAMRTVGASLLASAGLIGIVAGIAAQSTLGNFFAGLQIAFSDTVRIGDTVVLEGQQGTVEEITLSYLVLRLWDQRRLVVPVSYFVSRPFENWTRRDPGLLGWVLLHLDHRTPVEALRAELERFLASTDLWDGEDWSLTVTDTTPSTIVVRALMTARNPDDAGNLKLAAREHLIAYLRDRHPESLPRIRTD